MEEDWNLLSPIGYRSGGCGYCHNKSRSQFKKRYSYYACAESLTPQFYEDLLGRGWRRSGTLLYRSDQRASCCPHYTIRLDAAALKATKDQRQALNRFNHYVLGEDYITESARSNHRSRQEAARRKTEFDLIERIHESELLHLKTPPRPAHELVMSLEPDDFTEEKYFLYENYQRIVHQEPPHRITESGFRSFLCQSPLKRQKRDGSGTDRPLGSYHQCYRLDGKLVAVGVLDILPHAISAVYFMYHESIHRWSPGKMSALRETALALEQGCAWYMMGFYIHSCKKMKYKVDFHPQYVLDPESYAWDLFDDDFERRLDARSYVSLSRERRQGIKAPERATDANKDARSEQITGVGSDDEARGEQDSSVSSEEYSLFDRDMPGILPSSEIPPSVLDRIKIRVGGQFAEASHLAVWETSSIDDKTSIRCLIAELVAAVGMESARNMCIAF